MDHLKIAIIDFPNSRGTHEIARAFKYVGLEAVIFLWKKNPILLSDFAGYIFPDLGKSLVFDQTKRDLLNQLQENSHKPMIGIGQGIHVLREIGLISQIELRPTANNQWKFVKVVCDNTAATGAMESNQVIPIASYYELNADHLLTEMVVFRYCTIDGHIDLHRNIAGFSNERGNVVGVLFNFERGVWLRQVPVNLAGEWGLARQLAANDAEKLQTPTPAMSIFQSFKTYISS